MKVGKMKKHIVLHTHWDREWYFTTSDSLVLMDRTFKNIIDELTRYPELSFCLDGQYSIIEEFLTINPGLEKIVNNLVERGQLLIGPWYTQTDTQLIDAESITRNLYYGMNQTKNRFGRVMEVGYLPDTFGFCHQMPEIYYLAGINKAIFWRGADFSKGLLPYFKWQGSGGSTVNTINFFGGYGMAKGFDSNQEFVDVTLTQICKNYQDLGIDTEIIIPVGNDQFEINPDMPLKIEQINKASEMNLKLSDYEKAIDSIFNTATFPNYLGEFRKTAYTRLHKSIGSVRYDLKQENYHVEQLLLQRVEPLYVIGANFAIKPSVELLYHAWKLLFEGHAHDGICGCVSDQVYLDMKNRIKRAKEIALSLENRILKEIAQCLDIKGNELLLINPSPNPQTHHQLKVYTDESVIEMIDCEAIITKTTKIPGRDDALVETAIGNKIEKLPNQYIHEVTVIKELVGHEITTVKFQKAKKQEIKKNYPKELISNHEMSLNVDNQQINLTMKNQSYPDFFHLIDQANDGDTYDFSPLLNDQEIKYELKNYYYEQNGFKSSLIVNFQADLPFQLSNRINRTNLQSSLVEVTFTLQENDPLLYINLSTNNQVLSHRLRLRINTGSEIYSTLSSSAYGMIERVVTDEAQMVDWEANNVEKPVAIETFDGFVKPLNNQLTVLSTWGKEYQADKTALDFTIFATTSTLGKSNLLNRPGRASGDISKKGHIPILTPLAECQGQVNYEMAITSCENNYFEIMEQLQNYRCQTISYQNQEINKFEGRIDNKLMDYRKKSRIKYQYEPLKIKTNGYITSIGVNLNGTTIVRGVANRNHYFDCNHPYQTVDLLGNKLEEEYREFMIFNYEIKTDE